MSTLSLIAAVGELVRQRPSRSRIFEQLGIDYCCGGKISLSEACANKGLDPIDVLMQLAQNDQDSQQEVSSYVNVNGMTLTELADHIQHTHHAYLKEELPRLKNLVHKVASVHGQNFPWMREVQRLYVDLASEMTSHMLKEEQILFPLIRQLDALPADARLQSSMSVAGPIRVMEHEHDDAGDALSSIRELTSDYTPPPEACNTFRAMLDALAYLEKDMHQHVHKENNVLFPKAMALESAKLIRDSV